MEDSKLQKLHETLKALAPKGKVGGLGFYAKAGHRSRRSAADGMPEDKRALYSFFVRAGDGPSGHTHFADDGDKKLKKKKKKKAKAPPPPSSDESSSSSSEDEDEDEAPPPPKKTKKRKEAAARLADIDAAYDSAQAAKARSIDEAFAASQASAAAPKKKKRKNGAAPVKKEKKRKKSKKKDR
jgi:hypothetical protein